MLDGLQAHARGSVLAARSAMWCEVSAIWLAISVAGAYFLAAQLGLALVLKPEGVAAFWPAAGIGVGTLIALGPGARVPVSVGVIVATVAARWTMGANVWLSIVLGFCNAGGTLLTAWLIERRFGPAFQLEGVSRVLGFLAAATLGAGIAAIGAATAIGLSQSAVPFLNVWLAWFASCALGTIAVAPLVIGLASTMRAPPQRSELTEGLLALIVLTVMSGVAISLPPGPWATAVPMALVLPVLLWLAVRCRPVFAAAAAFIVAVVVICSTTFGVGHFGDPSLPLAERILAAQTSVLAGTLCVFILAALFAERRKYEEALKEGAERLQLALDGAELGVWSVDTQTGRLDCDARDRHINGHIPDNPPETLMTARPYVHPDDLPRLDAAFEAAKRCGGPCKAEYRVIRPPGDAQAGQVRWVAVEGTVRRGSNGQPVRLLGVTRDITERKRAEERQSLLIAELDHRVKNALACVSVVAQRSREGSTSTEEFLRDLDGRIRSMADTHALLSRGRWQGVVLADLIRQELAPCTATSNTAVEGPDVVLSAEAAQPMAMVLHELVTNAAKYGALSTPQGRVTVRWECRLEANSCRKLALEWREIGGPAVVDPCRCGYGTSVIREIIPYELGGTVNLSLAPDGAWCRLEFPLTD